MLLNQLPTQKHQSASLEDAYNTKLDQMMRRLLSTKCVLQPKAAPPTAQPAEHDILGMSHTAGPPQPHPQSSRAAATGLEHIFSAPAPSGATSQRPEDIFAAVPPSTQPRVTCPGENGLTTEHEMHAKCTTTSEMHLWILFVLERHGRGAPVRPFMRCLFGRRDWTVSKDHLSSWRFVLQAPQGGSAPDSMIDFGDDAELSPRDGTYQPGRRDVDQEGEPEARKVRFPMHSGLQR